MKIIFVAGGTGGHIYPAIAVAKELKKNKPNAEIYFICRRSGKEIEIIKKENFTTFQILAQQPKNITSIIKIFLSFFECLFIIYKTKPQIIFALGNYLSVPVVLSGWLFRCPVVLHEQNVIPGKAIKFLSPFAKKIFISFNETEKYLPESKVIFTGNPVREIGKVKDDFLKILNNIHGKKIILIFGGSQGARSINNAVINSRDLFSKINNYYVIHITGERDYKYVRDNINDYTNYSVFSYRDDLLDIMSISDIVISRAGATTCSEIMYFGKSSVLIPYPYATGNHQEYNAKFLQNAGACVIIKDEELSAEKLFSVVYEILSNEERLKKMKEASYSLGVHNSKERIIKEIENIPTIEI